jgi:hypothetical protein
MNSNKWLHSLNWIWDNPLADDPQINIGELAAQPESDIRTRHQDQRQIASLELRGGEAVIADMEDFLAVLKEGQTVFLHDQHELGLIVAGNDFNGSGQNGHTPIAVDPAVEARFPIQGEQDVKVIVFIDGAKAKAAASVE